MMGRPLWQTCDFKWCFDVILNNLGSIQWYLSRILHTKRTVSADLENVYIILSCKQYAKLYGT